jgi:hypothetical protein
MISSKVEKMIAQTDTHCNGISDQNRIPAQRPIRKQSKRTSEEMRRLDGSRTTRASKYLLSITADRSDRMNFESSENTISERVLVFIGRPDHHWLRTCAHESGPVVEEGPVWF